MPAYLDHNATSTMHTPVIDAMRPLPQKPVTNLARPRRLGRTACPVVAPARARAVLLARLEIEPRQLHLGGLRNMPEIRLDRISGSIGLLATAERAAAA